MLLLLWLLLIFLKIRLSDEDFASCSLQPSGVWEGEQPPGLTSPGVGDRHRGIIFLLLFLCILFHLSNWDDPCVLFTIPLKWPGRVTWEVGTRAAGKEARGGDTGWLGVPASPNLPRTQPCSRGLPGHPSPEPLSRERGANEVKSTNSSSETLREEAAASLPSPRACGNVFCVPWMVDVVLSLLITCMWTRLFCTVKLIYFLTSPWFFFLFCFFLLPCNSTEHTKELSY